MVYWPDGFLAPVKPDDVDEKERQLDVNVLAALPPGSSVEAILSHGSSKWAFNHRVDVRLEDGGIRRYFLKVMLGELGRKMAHGEFAGVQELHAALPNNSPEPVAWGTYEKDPDRHFYLASFHEMTDWPPSVEALAEVVAKLHERKSPTGQFGFPVTTFCGSHTFQTGWTDTWEEFFARQFREEFEWEQTMRGEDADLKALKDPLFDKVIPRLLRPLQMHGRILEPTLCHGDLWHGNVGVDVDTDELILYDPCAVYGHHEFDLSCWRAPRYTFTEDHREAYFELIPPSEPKDEYDDRNALYRARQDIAVSILFPENTITRASAIEEIKMLVAKYGNGLDDLDT